MNIVQTVRERLPDLSKNEYKVAVSKKQPLKKIVKFY